MLKPGNLSGSCVRDSVAGDSKWLLSSVRLGSAPRPLALLRVSTATIFGCHGSSESEFDRCRSDQKNVRSANMAVVLSR